MNEWKSDGIPVEHPHLKRASSPSLETERASEKLVNQRLAYVAVSRGQYDARIYTDDKAQLPRALDRDVSHRSALERTPAQASGQSESRESSRSESVGHSMAVGST
jgi:hypothetical protein